jgi:hypothetical protein
MNPILPPNSPASTTPHALDQALGAVDEAWALFIARLMAATGASTKSRTGGGKPRAALSLC